MDRTITVKGRGHISLKPDTAVISINLTDVSKRYEDALKESSDKTSDIKLAVAKSGLDPNDLKTSSFNIDTEYKNVQDKNGRYRQVFSGYRYSVKSNIRFPHDNKILGKLLYNLSESDASPEFFLSFTVKDAEQAKNEILEKAVADSKMKAEVMCKAADVRLGQILHIDYSWGEIEIYSRQSRLEAAPKMMALQSFDMDIEPEDIDFEDTVTIIWEIT